MGTYLDEKDLAQHEQAVTNSLQAKYGKGMKGFIAFNRQYGLGAVLAMALTTNANAAINVKTATDALTTDGTEAITAVGMALITLAGIAVVFKWVKAAFFS